MGWPRPSTDVKNKDKTNRDDTKHTCIRFLKSIILFGWKKYRVYSRNSDGSSRCLSEAGTDASWHGLRLALLEMPPTHPVACVPGTQIPGKTDAYDETPRSCSPDDHDVISGKNIMCLCSVCSPNYLLTKALVNLVLTLL